MTSKNQWFRQRGYGMLMPPKCGNEKNIIQKLTFLAYCSEQIVLNPPNVFSIPLHPPPPKKRSSQTK